MWRVVAVLAIWTTVWWLVIGTFAAGWVPGGWATVVGVAALAVSPLLVLIRRRPGTSPAAWVRLLIFRPFWYVQLGTPLVALASLAGAAVGLPFGAWLPAGRVAMLTAVAAFTAAAIAGYVGSRRLLVRPLDAWCPWLPAAVDGLRIAQVSDLHVGPHTPPRFLARVVQAIAHANADIVAFTGDQVDDFGGDVDIFTRAFAQVRAPLGVFAIAGNHDIYAGWPVVKHGMSHAGMTVLENEAVPLMYGGQRLWLGGTGDPAGRGGFPVGRPGGGPNIPGTLARVPAGEFVVVLAHNPALWPALAERGVDLTLSGHTHYGQFALPRLGWSLASMFLELAMGWHEREGALLYINPGTNYWGLPLRIGARPEVTIITLRYAADGTARISVSDTPA